jgi:hypothetical protein
MTWCAISESIINLKNTYKDSSALLISYEKRVSLINNKIYKLEDRNHFKSELKWFNDEIKRHRKKCHESRLELILRGCQIQ